MNASTTTVPLDRWQLLFHEAMAALLRAKEAVKQKLGLWGLLNGLWRSSHNLKAIIALLKALSEAPDGLIGTEFVKSEILQLHELLRSIEELIDIGKRNGLMNRTLTAGALGSINLHAIDIADYLEALEMSIDPEVLRLIEEGRSQIDRGDYEIAERLF